ncbi:hypothetical protein FDA33_11930 [Clostridium botulinum]|nr:hypothetical protein [Clostridium botulinum]NFI17336.1 hypothetical protein [Clostridium botulinum]NFL92087.1 hypothetical protein [Clostridium botulinum]NFN52139.1 hypothetical protein [Clostridium botulinum]NFO26648.1 hypothetical protein [Clostridium botulinum]
MKKYIKCILILVVVTLFSARANATETKYEVNNTSEAYRASQSVNHYILSYHFTNSTTPEEFLSDLKNKLSNSNISINLRKFSVVKDTGVNISLEFKGQYSDQQNSGYVIPLNGRGIQSFDEFKFKILLVDICPAIERHLGQYHFTNSTTAENVISYLTNKINDPNIIITMDQFNITEACEVKLSLQINDKRDSGQAKFFYSGLISTYNSNIINKYDWRQLADGTWNYYDASGKKIINSWYGIDGKFYYFNESGTMVTGWYLINNDWYHFNESGARNTGWYNDNGKWYYLTETGKMLTNSIIEGTYMLDKSGVWIQ